VAAVLAAAVETGDESAGLQPDGTLVAAIRELLDEVTAPKAGRGPCLGSPGIFPPGVMK
jgi:hypothetical protein